MAKSITTTQARSDLLGLLAEVTDSKLRVKIMRRGKAIAAIVPIEDLERIEASENGADKSQASRIIGRIRSGKEKTIPVSARTQRRRKS